MPNQNPSGPVAAPQKAAPMIASPFAAPWADFVNDGW